MNTVWVLTLVTILAEPTIDGEIPGHVISSGAYGYAETEEACNIGGKNLSELLSNVSKGSAIIAHACTEVSEEVAERIANAQGWESQ